MKIPADALIADAKLRNYLLVCKEIDDKSLFLAQAGFTRDEPEFLEVALSYLIKNTEAVLDRINEYGTFYEVSGDLLGSNERILAVTTIWLEEKATGKFRFIPLIPRREK